MIHKKKITDNGERMHNLLFTHFENIGGRPSAWEYVLYNGDEGHLFKCYPPESSMPVHMPVHIEHQVKNYIVRYKGYRQCYQFGASARENAFFASHNDVAYQWDASSNGDIYLIAFKGDKQLQINLSSSEILLIDIVNEDIVEFLCNRDKVYSNIQGKENPNRTDLNELKMANALVSFYKEAFENLPEKIFDYIATDTELAKVIKLYYADLVKCVDFRKRYGTHFDAENIIFSESVSKKYDIPAGEYLTEIGYGLFSDFRVHQIKKGFFGKETIVNRFTSKRRRELIADIASGEVVLVPNSKFQVFKSIGESSV